MNNNQGNNVEKILGLDMGPNSIGWALIEKDSGGFKKLIDIGVRVFEAGVDDDIDSGKDKSRATARREARLHRRQLARRARRMSLLAAKLQHYGLLPQGDLSTPESTRAFFDKLDSDLSLGIPDPALIPYILRTRALDNEQNPHATGRALYHLAQRRGYLSNRKVESKEAEKENKIVEKSIGELKEKMKECGVRTLGEYFSKLDPREKRIRQRYLGRDMVLAEFNSIWDTQSRHHPEIFTDEARREIHLAIFFQRPLKSNSGSIGKCEFENRRRAPLALLISQRFRLLQRVNDLRVVSPEGISRPLTEAERAAALDVLEFTGTMKFTALRKKLNLQKFKFNFELSGEKGEKGEIYGNRTSAKLARIFGKELWRAYPDATKEKIIHDIRSIRKHEARKKVAVERWGLTAEKAEEFAKVLLEEGYIALSRAALEKLVPLLEKGVSYSTAVKEIYPRATDKPLDFLPSQYSRLTPDVNNPAVRRTLTELRKVVNAIVRKHGKPDIIRVELARNLKQNRKKRKAVFDANNKRRGNRKRIKKKLEEESAKYWSNWDIKRSDIEKWQLAEECGMICPYTGKQMGFRSLFVEPQFDIEHIIPFSRSLDNSFLNKTLCYHEENRNVKRNQTPWEAYGDTDKWDGIINRVKKFKGDARQAKLRKFQTKKVDLSDFTSRQLNDTRYASKLAMRYLGLLYASGSEGYDLEGRRRVQASSGGVTFFLRNLHGLNSVLAPGPAKTREDHRHHAIDAVCVALAEPATVKLLGDAAEQAEKKHAVKNFDPAIISEPWPGFKYDISTAVKSVITSHAPQRKVNKALHKETIYSKIHTDEDGEQCVHIRKKIENLTQKMIKDIVDPVVKEKVIDALGGGNPAQVFKDPANHPFFETKDGRIIPIHSVKVSVKKTITKIGKGIKGRNVVTSSNHHIEIFEVPAKKNKTKWVGRIVSTLEAMDRLRRKAPVVDREPGEDPRFKNGRFLFSLCGGDIIRIGHDDIELLDENGKDDLSCLYRVRTVTIQGGGMLTCVRINDARPKKEIGKEDMYWPSVSVLKRDGCRKVNVTPLGEVIPAND